MTLTDTQLLALRDEVFGPCTVIGECFSVKELEADIDDIVLYGTQTEKRLRAWFKLRLEIELDDIFPEWKYPNCPTEEQLIKEKKRAKEVTKRLKANFKAFLATLS